jgi:ribosomal protein S18 acetylase RimI-like enzyme
MKILSGKRAGLPLLAEGFNAGFQDYKYGARFSVAQLARYLRQSGIDMKDCAVLVNDRGTQGWGTALLAVQDEDAWCGGLAVAPYMRKQGWGKALMETIQSCATEKGARRLLLEVLVENTTAQRLYADLGYQRLRELLIWEYTPAAGNVSTVPVSLQRVDAAEIVPGIVPNLHHWHRERPYWKRTAPILAHQLDEATTYALADATGAPVAYLLCREPQTDQQAQGDQPEPPVVRIIDIAAQPHADMSAVGGALLRALQAAHPDAKLTLLNEPAESAWNAVLEECGFQIVERQYEMELALD